MEHEPIAGWRSTLGLQTQAPLQCHGRRAYVQPTDTQRHSLYLLEAGAFKALCATTANALKPS